MVGGEELVLVARARGGEHHARHRGIVSRDALFSCRHGPPRHAGYESGPEDGVPVVLIHGNLSTGRFYEHLFDGAPERYRLIAPDMRGFGETERKPIDATRGLRDWADDTAALLRALGDRAPPHLVGWSTGGAAIAAFALDRPVASLTFIDPVGPYGFGATSSSTARRTSPTSRAPAAAPATRSSPPAWPPATVQRRRHRAAQRAAHAPTGAPTTASRREDMLLDEVLKSVTGDDGYPGDTTTSEHWPGVAPGTRGILNALSPKYCNWSAIVDLDPKPPILWTHGTHDIVIADGSPWEMGTLGSLGVVPGWPGEDAFPPQPMVTPDPQRADRVRGARRARADDDVRGLRPLPAARRARALGGGVLRLPGVGR